MKLYQPESTEGQQQIYTFVRDDAYSRNDKTASSDKRRPGRSSSNTDAVNQTLWPCADVNSNTLYAYQFQQVTGSTQFAYYGPEFSPFNVATKSWTEASSTML